jgi:hypothetical protein
VTRLLAALLLASPVAAAPALKSKGLLYHPTHVGTTREYEYQGGDGFREIVTKWRRRTGSFASPTGTKYWSGRL